MMERFSSIQIVKVDGKLALEICMTHRFVMDDDTALDIGAELVNRIMFERGHPDRKPRRPRRPAKSCQEVLD